jgi:hypothetical protein
MILPRAFIGLTEVSYPFTKFGTAQAEIIQIDNTVTSTKDVLRTLGLQAEEPGYLATIKIIESSNSNLEIDYQKDGLTGRASVMLEEHSLRQYMIRFGFQYQSALVQSL